MRRTLLLLACLFPAGLAFACGGGDDGDDDITPTVVAGSGNDEDYLRAVCVGTSSFSDSLLSATSVEEIRDVVRDFADEMRALNPPADLSEYNVAFVAYLDAAVDGDPTSLVTTSPPEPPADARRRLAALEPSIDECRDPTFFSRDDDETPTP